MRVLEQQNPLGSTIKVKKYETMIGQIWELLPSFCHMNCQFMTQSFSKVLKELDKLLNTNAFGLRLVALKTFSAMIYYCKNTKNVDE